jgi:hypothetical protein
MKVYPVKVKSYKRKGKLVKGYTRRYPAKLRKSYESYLGKMEIRRRRQSVRAKGR